MNSESINPDDQHRAGRPIHGRHIRFEDDDADTTICPSRYRDWMRPMRLQPVPEPTHADDLDQAGSYSPGVHLRLDDGEEWSLIDPAPAADDTSAPRTETDPDAK